MSEDQLTPEVQRMLKRRELMQNAGRGALVLALGGAAYYVLDDDLTRQARAQTLADGRPRLPPGQKVIRKLKPMGGIPGSPHKADFKLRVHGAVGKELTLDFAALSKLTVHTQRADVHCVTGWSVLDAHWKGVRILDLAGMAQMRPDARYVIFEAAAGYTANAPVADVLEPNCMVTWELDGRPLKRAHGAPVRALVPDLYFWKSAKYLTGIKFARRDEPGYWETRGYHNRADPWKEQRYG